MTLRPVGETRRVTVMGLGLFGGGAGAARFWADLGARVTVTDLRDAGTLAPALRDLEGLDIAFHLGAHREADFKDADIVVVNPAVRPDNRFLRLARSAGAHILTEVGLVFRIATGPVLAVTGTTGKSTTTALLGSMLRAYDPRTLVGGNLGGSLLPRLRDHVPTAPIVLELSSAQLHYLKEQEIAPDVAVVTNLAPNHLDWHRTVLNYYEAKRTILRFQSPEQVAILPAGDETLAGWAREATGRVLFAAPEDPGTEHAAFLRGGAKEGILVLRWEGVESELAPVSRLRLRGAHNRMNALLACAAAWVRTRDRLALAEGLGRFEGLPHRLEAVATARGVTFVNDSKSTTPEATLVALESFPPPVALLCGGSSKGLGFGELGRAIAERAHTVVLVGQTAAALGAAVRKAQEAGARGPGDRPATVVEAGTDFEAAVRLAYESCPDGGTVLLSPACASHDMFRNFEDRGERFRRIACAIAGDEAAPPGEAAVGPPPSGA